MYEGEGKVEAGQVVVLMVVMTAMVMAIVETVAHFDHDDEQSHQVHAREEGVVTGGAGEVSLGQVQGHAEHAHPAQPIPHHRFYTRSVAASQFNMSRPGV